MVSYGEQGNEFLCVVLVHDAVPVVHRKTPAPFQFALELMGLERWMVWLTMEERDLFPYLLL